MSYTYQPEQPRNSGTLYPGWTSTVQYTPYTTSMERDTSQWSNSTGTSNQAWSPESGERSYVLAPSPVTPTSAGNSPGYYPRDTQAATTTATATATATGDSEGDWSLYYNFVVPKDQRKEAYWELQDQYQPSEVMPERRPIERQKKSGREVYPCLYPGCTNSKPFKRTADLQRHYTQLHAPPNPSMKFHCDYPRCLRAKEPLGRKDHYRDHLRDYHGEDLVKRVKEPRSGSSSNRGKSKSGGSSGKGGGKRDTAASSSTRVNVNKKWWRCTRCLERKMVSDGWFCHVCKRECEEERIANRTQYQHHSSHHIDNIENSSTSNPDEYYSENNDSDEIIKSDLPSTISSASASASRSKSQYHHHTTSAASRTAALQQSSNIICIYQCNNTWIYNSLTNAWDPCPSCQGSINDTGVITHNSVENADDVEGGRGNEISTYQVSYVTTSPLHVNTTSTAASGAGAAWQHQSSVASGSSTTTNINTTTSSTATSTSGTNAEGYKTNCGNCSNYMVWDGHRWEACLVCSSYQGDVVGSGGGTLSGSGSGNGGRRGGGREGREKEKEKKRSKRSSGWFG